MDSKSKYNTDRLTHILIEHLGWVPVDDGEYETIEAFNPAPERVWFRSEKKAICVDANRIIGWKYAAPSEVRR